MSHSWDFLPFYVIFTTTHAVGEIKLGEIFVPIQSMSIERNFYPAKILCYTVLEESKSVCARDTDLSTAFQLLQLDGEL